MVSDHTKTSSELKPLAMKAKIEVPTALDDTHQKMLDKLKGLKGNDFTKQYHSDQDTGHKQAVNLFERYAKGGQDADLKTWAGKTLPHLQQHYKMAQDLDKIGDIARAGARVWTSCVGIRQSQRPVSGL